MPPEYDVDDAADAILKSMGVKPGPERARYEPEEDVPEEDEEDLEGEGSDPADEAEEDGEEGDEEGDEEVDGEEEEDEEADEGDTKPTKASKKVVIDPETQVESYVRLKVGGKPTDVKVADLAKLYGDKNDYTFKAAEQVEAKKATDQQAQKYAAGLEAMLERAQERAKPYANLNFLALTKDPNISPEELSNLGAEAQKAFDDVNYLQKSLDGVVQEAQKARHTQLVKQGAEAWKVLSDPTTGIKGWDQKTYNDVSSFAVTSGIDKRVMDELVDPAAIKLIHMAMLYSKGQAAAKTLKKTDKTPKRIIKGAPESTTQRNRVKPDKDAQKRFAKSGSIDDAAAVFMARMAAED